MADRNAIRIPGPAYDRLAREARRREMTPDDLAASLLDRGLGSVPGEELDAALDVLAKVRGSMPADIDARALVRGARSELERRSA